LNIWIGDQDFGQLATPTSVPDPVALQGSIGLYGFGPFNVHSDGWLLLDQSEKGKFNKIKFFE
jgi:hypothetical protein